MSKVSNFALIGAAGFIAPRHLRAIKDTGNRVSAAFDPHDSVGILDSYFPDADFFVEFERFDRHLEKQRRSGLEQAVDYISICSPNYLHDAHIRFALRLGADAICEKPVVLNPWNIDALREIEEESGHKVHAVLQMRLHPAVTALRQRIQSSPADRVYDVDLTYITARGRWYQYSWKGDEDKSGGIATNIGIHFFDMLHFLFGPERTNIVHYRDDVRAAGFLEYRRARVRWFLSIAASDLPLDAASLGQRSYRCFAVNGEEIPFSGGFTDLHTRVYEGILAGEGFGLDENRPAIETASQIRKLPPVGLRGDCHPYLKRISV